MKRLVVLLIFQVFLSVSDSVCAQQVPNGDFEQTEIYLNGPNPAIEIFPGWMDETWSTLSVYRIGGPQSLFVVPGNEGGKALQFTNVFWPGSPVDLEGNSLFDTVVGSLIYEKIPLSNNPTSVSFDYKWIPGGAGDSAAIVILVWGYGVDSTYNAAWGHKFFDNEKLEWGNFVLDLTQNDNIDSVGQFMNIYINNNASSINLHFDSELWLDNFVIDGFVGIEESISQQSIDRIEIFDVQGRMVLRKRIKPDVLNIENPLEGLQNGVYIIKGFWKEKAIHTQKVYHQNR